MMIFFSDASFFDFRSIVSELSLSQRYLRRKSTGNRAVIKDIDKSFMFGPLKSQQVKNGKT